MLIQHGWKLCTLTPPDVDKPHFSSCTRQYHDTFLENTWYTTAHPNPASFEHSIRSYPEHHPLSCGKDNSRLGGGWPPHVWIYTIPLPFNISSFFAHLCLCLLVVSLFWGRQGPGLSLSGGSPWAQWMFLIATTKLGVPTSTQQLLIWKYTSNVLPRELFPVLHANTAWYKPVSKDWFFWSTLHKYWCNIIWIVYIGSLSFPFFCFQFLPCMFYFIKYFIIVYI